MSRVLGPCKRCGITLMSTSVMGWPGHASPPPAHHYPVLTTSAAASIPTADVDAPAERFPERGSGRSEAAETRHT